MAKLPKKNPSYRAESKRTSGFQVEKADGTSSGLTVETVIYEGEEKLDERFPYCVLPPYYFDHALSNRAENMKRVMFSVHTWDGRNVLSVESGSESGGR